MSSAKPQKVRYTRRYPRFPLDVRMTVQVFRNGETSYFWGRSTEFAQDGMGGTLTGELAVGEVVSLEFSLHSSPMPLRVRAIVRYQIGLHYGFEFLTLTAAQRTAVESTCERLAAG